jgi:rSAM/selenodomain-associated transferase 1
MVDLAGAAVVAILTRAPSSGGKSRLFSALGRAPDPALLTALLLDTIDAAAAPGITRVVIVDPPQACDEVQALVPGISVLPQAGGTLGARMRAAMQTLFDCGARAVALIGSDLPDLQRRMVAETFAALELDRTALVLGPAEDGGYYLVAATRVPQVFDGIEWSTDRVLSQTLARAEQCGVRVHLLEPLSDVDTTANLSRVAAPRTREWVRSHKMS